LCKTSSVKCFIDKKIEDCKAITGQYHQKRLFSANSIYCLDDQLHSFLLPPTIPANMTGDPIKIPGLGYFTGLVEKNGVN